MTFPTPLERPLPLPVVVIALAALASAGFTFGLRNALKDDRGGPAASSAPLAEVSGVPVLDAKPIVAAPPPPPPVEQAKVEPVVAKAEVPVEEAPVIAAPPADPTAKPEAAPQVPTPPKNIEDLY
jgi:hypothetical protein